MSSYRAIVLAVCLHGVFGWSYFKPMEWSPAPFWARYLIFGVTTVWISRIDVCPPRIRVPNGIKLFVETIVSYALLEIVPNGVWCRIEPLIHRNVRSICFHLGMDAYQYLRVEYLLLGCATTAVAWIFCCTLNTVLKWIKG